MRLSAEKIVFTVLLFAVSAALRAASLAPVVAPDVHCIAVLPNGDVTITWSIPPDPDGTFNSYHVFSSTNSGGPFTDIDSVFVYGQGSTTIAGANANAFREYYYVETRSNIPQSVYMAAQDTLSTIFLQVTNNNNIDAVLAWNNISTPPPSTQLSWFYIYREYPVGNWVLIDSTQSLTYNDSIQVCNSQVNYRIEIGDATGCTSVSNVAGAIFHDDVIPAIPVLDSATVNGSGNASLGWQPSTSPDVIGYVIYEYVNGIWTSIDTVWGRTNTSYTYLLSMAGQQSEDYVVAAFDSCGNISAFSSQHHTLFLQASFDVCSASANLSWNGYINFPGGPGGYNIFSSMNGGPWTLLATVGPGTTSYTQVPLTPLANYCYYVQAFNSSDAMTSQSQQVCLVANTIQEPVYNYLRYVTVTGRNSIRFEGYVDPAAKVQSYKIFRADTSTGPWQAVAVVPANPPSTSVSWTDNSVNTNLHSYAYRMTAVDSCGADTALSNFGQTIFLSAFNNDAISNTLLWNDYAQWDAGVSYYKIFRITDGALDPVPIAAVPFSNAGENTYTDDVSGLWASTGHFGYLVEGVEDTGGVFGFADSTFSNEADVIQQPLVFVPNAFTPNGNGLNDVFKPSNGFVDVEDYDFTIFDRWGQKVFETHDKTEGWDGTFHGKRCERDVYVWLLTFKTSSGQYIDQKGTVTLVH